MNRRVSSLIVWSSLLRWPSHADLLDIRTRTHLVRTARFQQVYRLFEHLDIVIGRDSVGQGSMVLFHVLQQRRFRCPAGG